MLIFKTCNDHCKNFNLLQECFSVYIYLSTQYRSYLIYLNLYSIFLSLIIFLLFHLFFAIFHFFKFIFSVLIKYLILLIDLDFYFFHASMILCLFKCIFFPFIIIFIFFNFVSVFIIRLI